MLDLTKYLITEEGYVFNKKDSYYNFDKWKKGSNNILYVTGLSGGGKTTIAMNLSKDYKAYHIELDTLEMAYQFINHPEYDYRNEKDILMIIEFYNHHPFKDPRKMNDDEYNEYQINMFNYMLKKMKEDKDHLYIVEGIQIITLARDGYANEIFNSPLIIKNTSMLTAIFRRWNRDNIYALNFDGIINENPHISPKAIFRLLKWYIDQEHSLNFFRKDKKGNL